MEKYTNEKSLMVVQDNFLTKVKRFFSKFFFGKDEEMQYDDVENEELKDSQAQAIKQQEPEQKEWKLYNFDADNNDDWPENINITNEENELEQIENNDNNQQQEETDYEKEPISQACKEKEELEQKLKNYYASITKMHK